jgi:hypothetical protein
MMTGFCNFFGFDNRFCNFFGVIMCRKWGFLGNEGILSQRGEAELSAVKQFQLFSHIFS